MMFMIFHILGRIIPTDELIFFREVAQPPSSHIILAVFFCFTYMIGVLNNPNTGDLMVIFLVI